MNGNLKVKDRITYEQGKLFQCLNNGWVKVLMDSGEVREYQPKDLIATIGSLNVAASKSTNSLSAES